MKLYFWLLKTLGIKRHSIFRRVMRFSFLVLGLFFAFFMSINIEDGAYIKAGFWLVGVISFAALEFVFADVIAELSFPVETERKMLLMEERLGSSTIEHISNRLTNTIRSFKACDRTLISGTVHLLTELNSTMDSRSRLGLLQLCDYVGSSGGRKGRVTQITQGVIGRCARTGNMETVEFADQKDYQASMVKNFGFTKKETASHTSSARSYLAYPIKREKEIIGVIYFFSTEPQIFPTAADAASLDNLSEELAGLLRIVGFV